MHKILLVDDSATIRSVIQIFLMAKKWQFTEAVSGELALKAAREQPFDLIITDYNMGGLNGLDVVRAVRAEPGPNQQVPIVLLTTERAETLQDEARAAGVNAFLRKPVNAQELLATVSPLLGG